MEQILYFYLSKTRQQVIPGHQIQMLRHVPLCVIQTLRGPSSLYERHWAFSRFQCKPISGTIRVR